MNHRPPALLIRGGTGAGPPARRAVSRAPMGGQVSTEEQWWNSVTAGTRAGRGLLLASVFPSVFFTVRHRPRAGEEQAENRRRTGEANLPLPGACDRRQRPPPPGKGVLRWSGASGPDGTTGVRADPENDLPPARVPLTGQACVRCRALRRFTDMTATTAHQRSQSQGAWDVTSPRSGRSGSSGPLERFLACIAALFDAGIVRKRADWA